MTDIEIRCPSCGMCYRGERETLIVPPTERAPVHVNRLLAPALELIKTLMDMDPAAESPEGVLLQNLAEAVQRYEHVYFPLFGRTEGPTS